MRISLLILFLFASALLRAQEFENPVNLGEKQELKALIERTLCYPEEDLKAKKKAKVRFDFLVEEDGSCSDLQIEQDGASEEMLEESLRIFELLVWKPASNLGEPEPFRHQFELNFHPSAFQKIVRKRGYACPPAYPDDADTSGLIYEQVEEAAMAGENRFALNKFIRENLVYPKEAFERNISGEVVVKLVVEPNGLPSNIHIARSLGGGCDEEALRIVSQLRWKAARNHGMTVRSWIEIPIIFQL